MEEITKSMKCPQCEKEGILTISGDLQSGWSGKSWGDGTFRQGIKSYEFKCPHCNHSDYEEEIHD